MTIFSLYIFDRHCECVYYQDWHRTRGARAENGPVFKANVHRLHPSPASASASASASANANGGAANGQGSGPSRESIFDMTHGQGQGQIPESRVVGARSEKKARQPLPGLPFDEEAKLVYGVILSLRNMVKKLSGRDEAFTSYSTPLYKLHLYETLTGYKFVLLSDPSSDSLRFVLRQLYVGPFVECVVRNPLVKLDSREQGIDNDQIVEMHE